MFSNARPVPSKAALKVLYQLAYISSGTAVGIATLCAEERRRRTLVVQKIADNARRIRQSPRHVRNKARRPENEIVNRNEDTRGQNDTFEHGDSGRVQAVRAPELPSAVSDGYAQIAQQGSGARRRARGRTKRTLKGPAEQGSGQHIAEVAQHGKPVPHAHVMPPHRRGPAIGLNTVRMSPIGNKSTSRLELEPTSFLRPLLPSRAVEAQVSGFLAHHRRHSQNAAHSEKQKIRAHNLLRQSIVKGLVPEIRDLTEWMEARGALSESILLELCQSCNDLIRRTQVPVSGIMHFYSRIVTQPTFQLLPSHVQIQARVAMLENFIQPWATRKHKLLRDFMPGPELRVGNGVDDHFSNEVTSRCYALLAEGNHECAANLLANTLIASASNGLWIDEYRPVFSDCINICIARADLAHAVTLWLIGTRHFRDDEAGMRSSRAMHRIVLCAKRTENYGVLRPICRYLLRRGVLNENLIDASGADIKAVLAVASITSEKPSAVLIGRLQQGLPPRLYRETIAAQAICRLKDVWQTTRSLTSVFSEYECWLRSETSAGGSLQMESFGPAEIALIEICNLAGRPDRALAMLTQSGSSELKAADTFSLAALTLAAKGSWDTLASLIGTAAKSQISVAEHRPAARRLDFAICRFEVHHGVAETWQFISDLVTRTEFLPGAVTVRIMLRKLASDQPSLIPEWLEYLRSIGVHFELDASTIVGMVRRYYHQARVPHVLLMHFCRELLAHVPALQTTELYDLIKQAIAYDIREVDTKRPSELRNTAELNLHNVKKSIHSIPLPITTCVVGQRSKPGDRLPLQLDKKPDRHQSQLRTEEQEIHTSAEPPMQEFALLTRSALQEGNGRSPRAGTRSMDADSCRGCRLENHNRNDHIAAQPSDTSVQVAGPDQAVIQSYDESAPPDAVDTNQVLAEEYENFETSETDDAEIDDEIFETFRIRDHQQLGLYGLGGSHKTRKQVRTMIFEFSRRRYNQVLDLYEKSLDSFGIPPAPLALAVAVEAHIRLDGGGLDGATRILGAAQEAGFNTSCAMAPILIREMRMMSRVEKTNITELTAKVREYYRANEENGWPASHHVGVSAANLLIDSREPGEGVKLLNSICQSRWASQQPPDIVIMTVFLKGFIALRSLKGILWTVHMVLNKDMRIDRGFLRRLRTSPKAFEDQGNQPSTRRTSVSLYVLHRLRTARGLCGNRRLHQRFETKKAGRRLIRSIRLALRLQQARSDEERRALLKLASPGAPHARINERSKLAQVNGGYMARRARARRKRATKGLEAQHWKLTHRGSQHSRHAMYPRLRAIQYRRYIKRRPTTSSGQPIAFRDYVRLKAVNGRALPHDLQTKPASNNAGFSKHVIPETAQEFVQGSQKPDAFAADPFLPASLQDGKGRELQRRGRGMIVTAAKMVECSSDYTVNKKPPRFEQHSPARTEYKDADQGYMNESRTQHYRPLLT